VAFPAETRRYAAECLAISRFDLTSRPVPAKRAACGWRSGQITYATLNYDRYWMSVLHTLAAFALYSGVGAATATGLGQCGRFLTARDRESPLLPNGEDASRPLQALA